ncbi:sister p-glycoprotein, partial [Suillus cothurnatus]
EHIAIICPLLWNPKIPPLDEATSALDSSTEKVVQEAVDQATQGRATIGIVHCLSTNQNANHM